MVHGGSLAFTAAPDKLRSSRWIYGDQSRYSDHDSDALGKRVIAEGVETVACGDELLKLGCCYAQGYGIAEPMPAEEIPPWLDSYVAPLSWCQATESAQIVPLREAVGT